MGIKETETLIGDLESRLEAVKPMYHPLKRILPWIGFMLAYMVGSAFFIIGIRPDIAAKFHETGFLFETGLTLAVSLVAALTASWLSVPDMRGQKWLLAVPVSLFAVFLFWFSLNIYNEGLHLPETLTFHKCAGDAMILGLLPIMALVFLTKTGATTRPYWMAFSSILSVGALGWAVLRFTCASDDTAHIALYHFLPFIVLGILLGIVARRVYHW